MSASKVIVLSSPPTLIQALKQPTSSAWVEQAIANLNIILLDHSHCERKAAGVALNLMFRYPSFLLKDDSRITILTKQSSSLG